MSIFEEKNVICLANGSLRAAVVPEIGMNLAALRLDDRAILREPDGLETLRADPVVYGNPLQLPANRTEGARFSFDGTEYSLPLSEPARNNNLHGLLHSAAFTVTGRSESYVRGEYENHGEIFPFPFRVTVEICLTDSDCCETIRFENIGDKDMPLVFGVHTLFAEEEEFAVPIKARWEVNENFIPTGKLCPLQDAETRYNLGAASRNTTVSGFYLGAGHTARMGTHGLSVSENFTNWVLWNFGGDKGFLAIEPQQGPVNALNSKIDLIRLKPGDSEIFTMRFHEIAR